MQFCQSCGSIIQARDEHGLVCSCGHRQQPSTRVSSEQLERPKELEIVERTINPLAQHDHVCTKCGYLKAQLVSKGVWVTDEDEWFEYICGKCGHHDPEEGLKPK